MPTLPFRSHLQTTLYILYGRPVKSSTRTTLADGEDEELRRTIGLAARAARSTLHMTQAQVATAIGVVPEVYGRIERGLLMPSVLTLVAIARTLRVSPDELLGWKESVSRDRPAEYERILSILDRCNKAGLERARGVLEAVFAETRSKE
ncbi:MAG TPA: helix-turn-helix domain-containing protein [Kofleriaceae bacterium]|nr:helix-turn-helix domain-containing protein [Kofleriaceae bacterium]